MLVPRPLREAGEDMVMMKLVWEETERKELKRFSGKTRDAPALSTSYLG